MKHIAIAATLLLFTCWPLEAADKDPLTRTYVASPADAFQTMGQLIVGKGWKIVNSDKDLCIISYQAQYGTVGGALNKLNGHDSNYDSDVGSLSCRAVSPLVTRITANAGRTGWLSGGINKKFAAAWFKEIDKVLTPVKE